MIVYGIPNCDTVKRARKWLTARGVEHQFVDFRKNPVGGERTAAWVDALGPKALKNTSGGSYRGLPPDKKTWDEGQWKTAMAADPMLIKRPVIERDGVAVIAGFRASDADLELILIS